MHNSSSPPSANRSYIAVVLLWAIVLISYSNTFDAAWHFDDYQNIVLNPQLKLNSLSSYESIKKTFYSDFDGYQYLGKKLYRPIPCFTFALNWYFGKNNVSGYHVVNISIHIITTIFLYFTVLSLFATPNLKDRSKENKQFLALLTATLWAINPIQIQAVTYIVQRMAAMAAMFCIISLFFYIRTRLEGSKFKSLMFFLICCISFIAGLGSKENAALLPASLVLVEFIFFQDLSNPNTKKLFFATIIGILVCVATVGGMIFFSSKDSSFLPFFNGYKKRPFTLSERVLTEPRIVLYYLSQIFYPIPERFSIEHDFALSTSLIHPWTTLPSIIIIFLLLIFGLTHMRKYPILSFAVLFFFLNHSIESTIISLELSFEHRNYLPSFFLFLPVAIGFKQLLEHYGDNNRPMYIILISFMIVLLSGIGVGTYVRNMAWSTEKTLWEAALKQAPRSARVHHNLAWGYYEKIKDYEKAMELYQKSLDLKKHNTWGRASVLNNIANLHYIQKDYETAATIWNEALSISPDIALSRYKLAVAQAKNKETEKALRTLSPLISNNLFPFKTLNLKGLILLRREKPMEALQCLRKCLKLKPNDVNIYSSIGICFFMLHDYDKARLYLKQGLVYDKKDKLPLLWLVETNLKAGNNKEAETYIRMLLSNTPIENIVSDLEIVINKKLLSPAPGAETIRAIADRCNNISKEIKATCDESFGENE